MLSNSPIIINFAPTGMVPTKSVTPHVPITPAEIIEQTHEAYELGITIVHLHARNHDESPAHESSVFSQIFEGVKKHCPDLVISATLSGRDVHEIEKRSEVLELKPDLASLTLSSLNFSKQASVNAPETIVGLINRMAKHGVKPELECFDAGMINYSKYLIRKNLIEPPFYYNILCGNIASAQADLGYLGLMLKDLPEDSYWALAGLGKEQLKMNTIAIAMGGGVRVGIEDNIWYDRQQKKLATNIELIKRVHRISEEFERKVMSPIEFGSLGFYNRHRQTRVS